MLTVDPHPLLDLRAFVTVFPAPLGERPAAPSLFARLGAPPPPGLGSDERVREAVRDLLRHGGFKPTGRSKPASEYLLRAVAEGKLGSINAAVDACNVASFHAGLPISVVDLDRGAAPFWVRVAPAGASYVFNATGQSIDVGQLLCLGDAEGPTANAVKDAQRTKTRPETRRTLSVVWGTRALPGRSDAATAYYRSLLAEVGATTEGVTPA